MIFYWIHKNFSCSVIDRESTRAESNKMMSKLALIFVLFVSSVNTQNITTNLTTQTTQPVGDFLKCVESYCLPTSYSSLEVPFNPKGIVEISVDFDTLQILEVDDKKFTVSFSMYFGIRWNDHRIVGPQIEDENYYDPIDTGFVKNLWVPDIYLWYLKSINVLDFLIPFSGKVFIFRILVYLLSLNVSGLWIKNGTGILYSQETHITFWCPMRFERYPLDKQGNFRCLFRCSNWG